MRHAGLATLAFALLLGIAPLAAQSRITWIVGAGRALPNGILNTYADNGWQATAGFERSFGNHRTSLRLDLSYVSTADTSGLGLHESTRFVTGMMNIVYHFVGAKPHLYALAGIGVLRRNFSSEDPEDPDINDSNAGIQVGEGVSLHVGRANVFFEGRFVTAVGPQPFQYFPVTLGVRIGGKRE